MFRDGWGRRSRPLSPDARADCRAQADKIQCLIKAANLEIEPIWASLFAKVRKFHPATESHWAGAGRTSGALW